MRSVAWLLLVALVGPGQLRFLSPWLILTSTRDLKCVGLLIGVNFVRLGGITYLPPGERVGRQLTSNDLGPVFATVRLQTGWKRFHDPTYHAKDGDAAFLDHRYTCIYCEKTISPRFRLAAYMHGQLVLFEADTNPHAHTGTDLLDIAGKVRYNRGSIVEQDGVMELGAIKDSKRVTVLIEMILQAPVNQSVSSQGNQRYFYCLTPARWHSRSPCLLAPTSGELSRGILLPGAF